MKRSKTGNVDTFCLLKAIFERNFSDNQIRYVMVRFVLELSGYIHLPEKQPKSIHKMHGRSRVSLPYKDFRNNLPNNYSII